VQYTPSPEHLTRLSLTRCLLQQAEQQIALPAPRQCLALLSLHDAIEMFLDTAAEAASLSWTPKMRQVAKVEPCP
jgi:hypothetical protein